MQLKELTQITDKIIYSDSTSYKVITSKQKELLEFIGANKDISKINVTVINKYIEHLKNKGNNNATINSKLAYLSKILTYAYQNEIINHKPYIPTFTIKITKEKYLNNEEIQAMLQWSIDNNQKELHDIILIGLNTGVRINNILSILPEHIENNYLRIIENKTNKPYSIPLNKTMQELFKDFKPFTMNYAQVYYIFNIMKRALNLDKNITIHTLRHTFCSNLIQKGVDIAIIQKLANHKKITTTMRYAHLNNKQLEEAVNIL
jgi:site-specific recombinase XerD